MKAISTHFSTMILSLHLNAVRSTFVRLVRASFVSIAASCSALAADSWTELFNGKNLNGWNQVRIAAVGDSIKTFLNDTPIPSGFSALQVHNIASETDKAGNQGRWGNLRIQEMNTTAKP